MVFKKLKKLKKKISENYNYMKAGMAEERKMNARKRVESNIEGVRRANPDMADRMMEEYKKLKKRGFY